VAGPTRVNFIIPNNWGNTLPRVLVNRKVVWTSNRISLAICRLVMSDCLVWPALDGLLVEILEIPIIGVTTLTRVLINLTVQQYYKDVVLTLVQKCAARLQDRN
jgi:hypothetical protein